MAAEELAVGRSSPASGQSYWRAASLPWRARRGRPCSTRPSSPQGGESTRLVQRPESLLQHPARGSARARGEGRRGRCRGAITVLNQTRSITFVTEEGEALTVTTRVVEERHWERTTSSVEVSRNFFARCTQTGDIYYFGEDVDIYEGGVIVGHDGAWRAGKNGARPGIIIPHLPPRGTILPGAGAVGHGSSGARRAGAHGDDAGRDIQGVRRGRGDHPPRTRCPEYSSATAPSSAPRLRQRREAGGVPHRRYFIFSAR